MLKTEISFKNPQSIQYLSIDKLFILKIELKINYVIKYVQYFAREILEPKNLNPRVEMRKIMEQ